MRQTPFPFEPNRGQTHPSVEFLARAGNFRLFLTRDEIVCTAPGAVSRFHLLGANGSPSWQAAQKLPGVTSYFIGRDPKKWQQALPQFARVERKGIYEGIDMELLGEGHQLEYRFQLAPHANPSSIRLSFPDAAPSLSPNGDLILRSSSGEFRHRAPIAFQNQRRVAVSFLILPNHEVSFHLPSYDPALPLVIDPVISFHLFHGGLTFDTAIGAAVDSTGDLYYTGRTNSLDFPVAGSPFRDFNSGNVDIFLARLTPTGSFVFSTYIGGAGNDEASGLALDAFGNSNIVATTYSTDLPIQSNAFQQNYGGNGDAVAIRMTSSGFTPPLLTYLGGSGFDVGTGVTVDPSGGAFFTGYTSSTNFPIRQARQGFNGGGPNDMFLVKVHPGGGDVLYSTYFGGEGDEQAFAVATDKDGNPHLTGRADCATLPVGVTLGPLNGNDLFVIKWKAFGDGAIWITCIGGNGADSGLAITVDASGNSFLTGSTTSSNFPTVAALQTTNGNPQNGSSDAFAIKLNPFGTSMLYSTYLGGSRDETGQSVRVNDLGEAFYTGVTRSPNFPSAGPPLILPTDRAGYLARLSPNGLTMLGSWFFDGVNAGDLFSVVLDAKANVYITGGASSGLRLPVTAAPPIRAFISPQDALILKLSNSRLHVLQDTFSPAFLYTDDQELTQRVINRGPEAAEHVTFRGILPNGFNAISCFASGVTCSTSGNSYRVDIQQLAPGAGVEVRTTLRPTATAFPGVAQQIQLSAVSDTYDAQTVDNFLTTTLFASATQPACSYALSNQSVSAPAALSAATVNVTAPFSCPWTATIASDWISFASPSAASGSANISFTVQANTLSVPRIGSVVVAGHRVTFLQAASGNPQSSFTDVPTNHPFYSFITLMKTNGITQGCTATTFCPDDLTTRGQMAVFLVRSVLGGDSFSHTSTPYFTDVPSNHPQFRYIQKLRDLGVTAGCTTTTYCPDAPVTRGQMAAFIVRGKLAVAPAQPFPYPTAFSFSDVDTTSIFYPSIQKMRELAITLGCTTSLYCPEDPTTRAQMSAFLIRAFLTP